MLTASQIIQRAIDSCGGDKVFDLVKNVEMISQIVTPKGDTLSLAVKRMNSDKYYISSMGAGFVNTTTVYNSGKAARISNQSAESITDPLQLEELRLQSYLCLEYGYKKLGYTLKREADMQFENFDCFVLAVSSPLGRTTANYYDKKTGKLIMIVYPNLSKSVFVDFYKDKGIVCPLEILMLDTAGAISESTLKKLTYTSHLDSNWFIVPAAGRYTAPEQFKTGTFKYVNSNGTARITRSETRQTEVEGDWKMEYTVEWSTDNDYLIRKIKQASAPLSTESLSVIKVKITGWTKNRYYCHYLSGDNFGGTCAFEKID